MNAKPQTRPARAALALLAMLLPFLGTPQTHATDRTPSPTPYGKVIADTAAMVRDPAAQALARKHGLQILNVTWEDTGRYKNSAVGPNISDMTIQVQHKAPGADSYTLTAMPVIRHPNFSDKTGDVPMERFRLLVGNEKGGTLRTVTLREFLGDLRAHLHTPDSWKGTETSLLAKRDTHVLVSAQACFLPIPAAGEAQFNPVLFNYQSYHNHPAVLTILVTREGSSVTVIDNVRDPFEAGRTWGQRLFYNKNGERASLTATRISDFRLAGDDAPDGTTDTDPTTQAAGEEGLNMVMLIQVPLKQPERPRPPQAVFGGVFRDSTVHARTQMESDVEDAVIGHGPVEGPFTEIDNLPIERDARFPVRVTVQFYKATSNGVVSEEDMVAIAKQIRRVYADADYVGSLVVSGETGRPTEHDGEKVQPADWWADFYKRHEANTGMTEVEVRALLMSLIGQGWEEADPAVIQRVLDDAARFRRPE